MGLKKPVAKGIELPALTKPASGKEIFYGYEAIDQNGGKLTGETPVVASSTSAGTPSVSGTNLLLKSAAQDNGLHIAEGGTVGLITALTNLGNATAADVASGKTFTSSAGLKVTGSRKIASGTYTFSSFYVDLSTYKNIVTLDFTPTTVLFIQLTDMATGGIVAAGKGTLISAGIGSIKYDHFACNSVGLLANSSEPIKIDGNTIQVRAIMTGTNNYFNWAKGTYYWVAIG